MHNSTIVVFSHLRWDFVYQRPQHLLSRLAGKRRVIVIEEPLYADLTPGSEYWDKREAAPNVTVCQLRTNIRQEGFNAAQVAIMAPMLNQLLQDEKVNQYVLWCYTAMAEPLAKALEARAQAVVYDAMDELSAFKGAPPELIDKEKDLLRMADVVFTGGPSLYRAKKDRHKNVHCFASSVDNAHFGQARDDGPALEPPEQAQLPHPRLGFYGVIDERLNLPLLHALAHAHADWQIIMVGPVVKIDPASLPRLPNIHYLGQRSYAHLPGLLKGWDLCLLPFALNESTRFISPTKTLEYMAAEKMIVSTPIRDVIDPYPDIVYVGHTPDEFIRSCQQALAAPDHDKSRRIEKMRRVLSRTSWEATAQAMEVLIEEAVERRAAAHATPRDKSNRHGPADNHAHQRPSNATSSRGKLVHIDDDSSDEEEIASHSQPHDKPALIRQTPVAVIGAGPTGLSAAYHLGDDALLIDQNDRVGGWCRSIEDRGFTFDYAGHIMFSNDDYVHTMYTLLLGDNLHWQNRQAWIYSKNVYTRYPFQGALYGLPPNVITECIMGAIEAHQRRGWKSPANPPTDQNRSPHTNGQSCKLTPNPTGKPIKDCCADGILETEAELATPTPSSIPHPPTPTTPANFEEFIYQVWGAGIAKHFAIPYNRKIWAVDLKEMETSWLGGRVPMPDLQEMIRGAIEPVPAPMGPNARFGYPLRGGFQALMDGFLPYVRDRLLLNTRVVGIIPQRHHLLLSDGSTVSYQQLISTMQLPVLIRMMGDAAPEDVRRAADGLRHTSVVCVNIGVGRENISDKHWIYYPEDSVFHRIFVQGNASPHCNAKGGFGYTCEITYSTQKTLPATGDDLIRLCIQDSIKVGFIKKDDPIWCANLVDMPYAYVVYDHARAKNVAVIRQWLSAHDILLAGRYSEWEYYNSDHAFIAGKKAAQEAHALQTSQRQTKRLELQSRRRRDAADRSSDGWLTTTDDTPTPTYEMLEEET